VINGVVNAGEVEASGMEVDQNGSSNDAEGSTSDSSTYC